MSSQASDQQRHPQKGMVSSQERSVLIGDLIVINGYHISKEKLIKRFAEGGYQVRETAHFLLFTRNEVPTTILVHRLVPASISKMMTDELLEELDSLSLLTSQRRRGEVLAGLFACTHFPPDVRRAWNSFGESIVQDLLVFVCATSMPLAPTLPALVAEALLYERIAACCTGTRILVAGANVSLCVLRLAERVPVGTQVVALEGNGQALSAAEELVAERHLPTIRLIQDDLSAGALDNDASFDTVVALHLIENLTSVDLFCVLAELLRVTTRRLILAAPPQDGGSARHDSPQQSSARVRLEAVGRWCLRKLGGAGHLRYERELDDLLIIEREGAAY